MSAVLEEQKGSLHMAVSEWEKGSRRAERQKPGHCGHMGPQQGAGILFCLSGSLQSWAGKMVPEPVQPYLVDPKCLLAWH